MSTTLKSIFGLIGFIILCTDMTSCKSQAPLAEDEPTMKDKMEIINKAGIEMMGGKHMLSPNQDSTLWLCIIEEIPTTYYGVIHEDGHVVLDKTGLQGTVEWHDLNSLITTQTPGRIENANKKRTKIIQLKQG